MPPETPRDWAEFLRACVPDPAPDPPRSLGTLRQPFALVRAGRRVPAPPAAREDPLLAAWWARIDPDFDLAPTIDPAAEGPLLARSRYRAIEVWTDSELAALHALWWTARRAGDDRWSRRLGAARRWHLEHTQPDNATNRPWAVHVFAEDDAAESRHYAATLVHNCLATTGRPEPASALILLDAATALEALGSDR